MDDDERTQPTQPRTDSEPIEIPIPERDAVIRDLMKVAPPAHKSHAEDDDGR